MALTDYASLTAAIADWLLRDDLSAVIPDFVTLAEAQINRDVRHWRMETRSAITLDARYVDLPTDWVETIRLIGDTNYRAIQLLSTDQLERLRPDATAGAPLYNAHTAGQIELFPVPGESYTGEILYYAKVPALATNSTNWLLTEAPDVYLYGSLVQSAPYVVEDERLTTWASLYGAAVQRLNDAGKMAKHSGTTLRVRPPR